MGYGSLPRHVSDHSHSRRDAAAADASQSHFESAVRKHFLVKPHSRDVSFLRGSQCETPNLQRFRCFKLKFPSSRTRTYCRVRSAKISLLSRTTNNNRRLVLLKAKTIRTMASSSAEKLASISSGERGTIPGIPLAATVVVTGAVFYGNDEAQSWISEFFSSGLSSVKEQCGKGTADDADDPFFGWPPSAPCVVSILPWILGALALGLGVALVSIVMLEETTESKQEARKLQFEQRHETIQEMMAELEDSFEGWTDDERGGIWFCMYFTALDELVEIPKHDSETVKDGCAWAFKLFERELRIAADNTERGQDLEYADKEKLKELLYEIWELVRLARRVGFVREKQDQDRLWKLYRRGWRVFRVHGWKRIVKAIKFS